MIPFDGDLLHLFYNKEILDYYNFQPPRTWQEYNEIAEKVHGQVFPLTNKTLMGSCIGRTPQCAGPYWAVQVLASMTQTGGSSTGIHNKILRIPSPFSSFHSFKKCLVFSRANVLVG